MAENVQCNHSFTFYLIQGIVQQNIRKFPKKTHFYFEATFMFLKSKNLDVETLIKTEKVQPVYPKVDNEKWCSF